MIRNNDWSYKDLLECLDYLKLSECRFRIFLERIVHPEARTGVDQRRFVDIINSYIARDGFELVAVEQMSGYPVYRVVKKGGGGRPLQKPDLRRQRPEAGVGSRRRHQ
jgi:AbiJ N-terminal domain 3